MPKINRGYISIADSLFVPNKQSAEAQALNAIDPAGLELTPDEYAELHGLKKRTKLRVQLEGPFQPILDAGKDVANTARRYKSLHQVINRDAMQFLRGLGNTVKGVGLLLLATPYIAIFDFALLVYAGIAALTYTFCLPEHKRKQSFKELNKMVGNHLLAATSALLEGTILTLRGITQMASFVFVPFKMLLRASITAIVGSPKIEDGKRVQTFVNHGRTVLQKIKDSEEFIVRDTNSMNLLMKALRHKLTSGYKKGQETDINIVEATEIDDQYRDAYKFDKHAAGKYFNKYLNLFAKQDAPDSPQKIYEELNSFTI